jgi:hypothetical protein
MERRLTTLAAVRRPFATWWSRTERSAALSAASLASVALGTFAKAASVGARTVNGPLPWSVPARPACVTSVVRVLKFPAATAVATMSFVGAADGTAGPRRGVAVAVPAAARAAAEAADTAAMVRMVRIWLVQLP